jgi:hypothetical protein
MSLPLCLKFLSFNEVGKEFRMLFLQARHLDVDQPVLHSRITSGFAVLVGHCM